MVSELLNHFSTIVCNSKKGNLSVQVEVLPGVGIAANTKHGNETRALREERSVKLAELYELEMLGRELGLISGGMVGRKPAKWRGNNKHDPILPIYLSHRLL